MTTESWSIVAIETIALDCKGKTRHLQQAKDDTAVECFSGQFPKDDSPGRSPGILDRGLVPSARWLA
jgi:hypothetical protein